MLLITVWQGAPLQALHLQELRQVAGGEGSCWHVSGGCVGCAEQCAFLSPG